MLPPRLPLRVRTFAVPGARSSHEHEWRAAAAFETRSVTRVTIILQTQQPRWCIRDKLSTATISSTSSRFDAPWSSSCWLYFSECGSRLFLPRIRDIFYLSRRFIKIIRTILQIPYLLVHFYPRYIWSKINKGSFYESFYKNNSRVWVTFLVRNQLRSLISYLSSVASQRGDFHEQKLLFEHDRGIVINWIITRSCRGIRRTWPRKTITASERQLRACTSAYFIEYYMNRNASLAKKTCPREMQSNIDEELHAKWREIFKGWFCEYYESFF